MMMNDPHLGAGHLPDFFEMSPVFAGEQLVGFVVGVIHATDVGGAFPGSQAIVGVTEAIQEGSASCRRALPRGEPSVEVFRIIEANVRVPRLVTGDLRALRSALHVGARELRQPR